LKELQKESLKLLLVNPYIYDFTAYDLWLRPLGLLYIASVIKKYTDCEIYWIDVLDRYRNKTNTKNEKSGRGKYHKEEVEKPEIYKDVPRRYSRYGMPVDKFRNSIEKLLEIDMILMTSLMTYWIDGVIFTAKSLKERFPQAKMVLGGVIPGLTGNNFPGSNIFDYTVSGYGENKVIKILSENGAKLKKTPDFSVPDNIPFPEFNLLGSTKYLPLLTSRGCPFSCTYCVSGILNKTFIQRSPRKYSRRDKNYDQQIQSIRFYHI